MKIRVTLEMPDVMEALREHLAGKNVALEDDAELLIEVEGETVNLSQFAEEFFIDL